MAQLGAEYPFPKSEDYPDWQEWHRESERALDEIPADKLLSFPVADGSAFYYVKSLSPLILQHIPYLDNYYIPYSHIRGLRRRDVEQQISDDIWFEELLKKGGEIK